MEIAGGDRGVGEDTGFALRACEGTHDPDDPQAACEAGGTCSALLSFSWSCQLDDGTVPLGDSPPSLGDSPPSGTCGLVAPEGCAWSLGARALAPAAYRFSLTVRHTHATAT